MKYLKIEISELPLEFMLGQDSYTSMAEAKEVQKEILESEGELLPIETLSFHELIVKSGTDSNGQGGYCSLRKTFNSFAEAEQYVKQVYEFDGEGVHQYESNE